MEIKHKFKYHKYYQEVNNPDKCQNLDNFWIWDFVVFLWMVRILFIIFISRKNSKLERKKDLLVIQFYFREILGFEF